MDSYAEVTQLWDNPNFSQLPDDDFIALLQKQFPTQAPNNGGLFMGPYSNAVNPQNLLSYSLPSLTPPSEDSSPSPPDSNQENANDDNNDSALKRKASEEDLSDGPNQKSQHTLASDKRGSTGGARRKSTGSSATKGKDEGRLIKRKEQNRAAQRAFRERKEKHVKDLEDKVADLEAKNERTQHENENLRDLLSRLQNENVALRQSSFTFSMAKTAPTNIESPTPTASQSNFSSAPSPQSAPSTSTTGPASPKVPNPLDWSSLTTFDPAMLNLLDDSIPQPTATEGAMQMDFGFGANSGLTSNAPYTTIASNPMFISFASTFDSLSPDASASSSSTNNFNNSKSINNNGMGFNFDINSLTTWPTPSTSQDAALDDLFSGYLTSTSTGAMDLSMLSQSPASISPVTHHLTPAGANSQSSPFSASSSSSPSPFGSNSMFTTLRDSPQSDGEPVHHGCPKTKKEFEQKIAENGASPFAPVTSVRKCSDGSLGTMIECAGSNFPKTAKSDKNIEVLTAWRSIRANPKFKDADITELCSEFTSKARCDGTKVVLEPQGVHSILESLSKKQ